MSAQLDRLIEKIQGLAVSDGDCWRWVGCFQSGATPTMRWGEKVSSVRRFILVERGDVTERSKALAGVSCGHLWCVNPEHVVKSSRAKTSRMAAENMTYAKKLAKGLAISESIRDRTKLSRQQARAIREDDRPQRLIAAEYGVHQYTVWAIKSGRMYRDYVASPFSQLMR
jgi:hypothetical protein